MATLSDIAREAGVSVNLVSYVLKKTTPPKSEKHKRILEIARNMNYVPNRIASALITGRTRNISLVCGPEFQSVAKEHFFLHFMNILSAELTAHGMGLSIYNTADEEQLKHVLLDGASDALIWYMPPMPPSIRSLILERNIPCVMLLGQDDELDWIDIDDFTGEYRLLEELWAKGHRHIAFAEIGVGKSPRLQAYEAFCANKKIETPKVIRLIGREAVHYAYLKHRILTEIKECSALVLCKDTLAITVCDILEDAGISVPDDISIAGYDDLPEAAGYPIPLTTVRQDVEGFTSLIIEHLGKRIAGEKCKLKFMMQQEPILRASVKQIW
ncbi:MAG: LacI family DNA-binding transcriptional regulator [Clostridia bacterium]|nr:LacI family DNA-binding transcriptional regulator [Clostridia bacterium]